MTVHFILLILSLVLLLFAVDKNKFQVPTIILFVVFFVLAFIFATFRDETIGNDTGGYVQFFQLSTLYDSFSSLLDITRFEPGYVLLNYIVSRFTDDYTVFFFVCNAIGFVCTIYFFRTYCLNKNAWPFLWLIWGTLYWSFSAVRAALAMCLLFLYFDAVLKNRLFRAIIWLLVAGSIHYSAFVCGIVLFLRLPVLQRVKKHKFLLVIGFLCIGIFLSKLMSFLPDAYSGYYTDSQWAEGGVRVASIMNFIFLGMTYLSSSINLNSRIKNISSDVVSSWKYYYDFRSIFLVGFGFSFLELFFNQFNRIEMFFIPLISIYIVDSFRYVTLLKKIAIIILMTIVAIYQIYAFVIRPEWLSIFPYMFRSL